MDKYPYVMRKRSLLEKMLDYPPCELRNELKQALKNRPGVSESETPDDHETRRRRWATLFGVPEEEWKEVE